MIGNVANTGPGGFRQRIALQSPRATAPDTDPAWDDRRVVWADVVKLAGRELVAAAQARAGATHRIRFPWLALPIDETWRAVWDGRPLNFASVVDLDSRRKIFEVLASTTLGETP